MKLEVRSNVTLSLPKSLLKEFKAYAASKNQSMSSLLTQAVRDMLGRPVPMTEEEREAAGRRLLERMRNPPKLSSGTYGKITWTRDEIHER